MSSFVINCFNFSLKPVCYFDSGVKMTLQELSSEEILKAARISNSELITLIGPTAITKKLKEEIEKNTDFSLKVTVVLQDRLDGGE
jgi:hypothetical protein